jgi:cobyric acid synthase
MDRSEAIKNLKAEAVKEFVESLKESQDVIFGEVAVSVRDINNAAKKLTTSLKN